MTTGNTPSTDPSTTPSPTTTPSENPTTAPTGDQNTNTSDTTTTPKTTDEGTTSQGAPQSAQNQTAENTTNKPKTPKVNTISQNTGEDLSNAFNAAEEFEKLKKENDALKEQIKELTASVNDLTKQLSVSKVSENQPAPAGDRKITVNNNTSDKSTETSSEGTEVNAETNTEEQTETQKSSSDKKEKIVSLNPDKKEQEDGKIVSLNPDKKEEKVGFWRRLGRGIKSGLSKLGSGIATGAKTVGNIVGYVPDRLSHGINFWTHAMSHPNGIFEKIGAVCSRPLRKGIELANFGLAGATKLFKRDSQELKTAWYQFRGKEVPNEESAKSGKKEDKIIKMDTATQTKKAA